MAASLADVARYAGVSEATVSRVLNDKPGVSESTRTAVRTAMDVLGYQRSAQIAAERFRLVGVIVPELRNPIFPAFAEIISAVLAQRGLASIVCVTGQGGMPEADYIDMLLERRVSGMVFVCTEHVGMTVDPAQYLRLLERGMPLVAVNGTPDMLRIPCVSTDDAAAVELSVRHLASLGHERIGLITGEDENVPSARKMAAFHHCMRAQLGLDDAGALIERSMYTMEGGFAATSRLLGRGVTAVICGSDVMAVGAIRAARQAGLGVPEDVSVVGYDDSIFMPVVDPPLTTVRQPVDDMARAIVSVLWSQMSGSAPRAEEILFQPDLVVRSSTGTAPAARRPSTAPPLGAAVGAAGSGADLAS